MEITNLWSTIRGVIREKLSFSQMKDLAGAVGLPVHQLANLQQGSGGASKGQLMDAIDRLYIRLDPADQKRVVGPTIAELLQQAPSCADQMEAILGGVGWGISNGEIHPLAIQIDLDTVPLPEMAREGIQNCLRRYRDGDMSGAVGAICGVVDSLTEEVYQSFPELGDHKAASYQERVNRAIGMNEASFRLSLDGSILSTDEIDRLWNNFRQACNQAAYVLASFRRNFSDVHGVKDAPVQLVRRAIDCAVFITRGVLRDD